MEEWDQLMDLAGQGDLVDGITVEKRDQGIDHTSKTICPIKTARTVYMVWQICNSRFQTARSSRLLYSCSCKGIINLLLSATAGSQ